VFFSLLPSCFYHYFVLSFLLCSSHLCLLHFILYFFVSPPPPPPHITRSVFWIRISLIMADWTECLNFGIFIAKQAREIILSAFQQHKDVKLKSSPADLVTETDQRVEKILICI
ncbi:hypothetical protein LDENG_00224870, partial [Lucifuga dentata]